MYDTFTINCQPLTVQRRDPIVSPGADLSDHVHSVIGGTNSLRGHDPGKRADVGRDNLRQGARPLHLLGAPAVPHHARQRVRDGRVQGSMVAGDPMKRTFDQSDIEQRAVNHLCFLWGGGSVQTNSLPLEQCIDIRSQVAFPSCWNSKDLDSPDHKSHMSYPAPRYGDYNGSVCPESHPIAVITIFYEFFFNTLNYDDRDFVFARDDKTGYGFHGDFGANGTPGTATPHSPEKPGPAEEIGLNGAVLAPLPGGQVPFGETPMRAKRSRVMAEEY
ncbi:hypothetical protein DL768_002619 [Monosporascus sp. mg162]|nr:hypothetical protein DL768_002619 [Monosporascus sp. mg162]